MNFLMSYYLIEKSHKYLKKGPKIKTIISFERTDNVESKYIIKMSFDISKIPKKAGNRKFS